MATKKKPATETTPAFSSQSGFGPEDAAAPDAEAPESEPTTEDAPDGDEADPRDAEIIRLQEEAAKNAKAADTEIIRLRNAADVVIARLRAELAASRGPTYEAGKKYTVSLKDGPTAVVQPADGEHPFEAFKRLSGVTQSNHAPEIHPAADDAPIGIVRA